MKWQEIPTPCYVVDEKKLKQNLKILQNLEQETGCHVLLAQKAFSMFSLYPLIGQYISGTTASGIFEARLGKRRWERKIMYLHRLIRKRYGRTGADLRSRYF